MKEVLLSFRENDDKASELVRVSKEVFDNFINNYEKRLNLNEWNEYTTYNDFSRGKWPDSIVAKVERHFYSDKEPDYYIVKDIMVGQ